MFSQEVQIGIIVGCYCILILYLVTISRFPVNLTNRFNIWINDHYFLAFFGGFVLVYTILAILGVVVLGAIPLALMINNYTDRVRRAFRMDQSRVELDLIQEHINSVRENQEKTIKDKINKEKYKPVKPEEQDFIL